MLVKLLHERSVSLRWHGVSVVRQKAFRAFYVFYKLCVRARQEGLDMARVLATLQIPLLLKHGVQRDD